MRNGIASPFTETLIVFFFFLFKMVSLFLFFEWWEGGNWEKIPFVLNFGRKRWSYGLCRMF